MIGVPPSYPVYPINGDMIGCFITPGVDSQYTYPVELVEEVHKLVGEYMVDVEFKVEDKQSILKEVYEMTEKRFKVIEYMLKTRDWASLCL